MVISGATIRAPGGNHLIQAEVKSQTAKARNSRPTTKAAAKLRLPRYQLASQTAAGK
ncbi:MAG: hypothetical protein IIA92_04385 [Chloroflexi bacterium]|nr:hypothetical protein [Chloroflexota bacterium]